MDNLEFCNLLKEAKRMSGMTNVDIIVALRKSQGAISDMLNGRGDYALSKYLPYIKAIGYCLTINSAEGIVEICNDSDATKWLQDMLSQNPQSSRELGEKLDVSHPTILRIIKGGPIRLSLFLKLVEMFNCTITLDALLISTS